MPLAGGNVGVSIASLTIAEKAAAGLFSTIRGQVCSTVTYHTLSIHGA